MNNYNFGLATCLDNGFSQGPNDGMFGLSPGRTDMAGEKKTVLEVAYDQGHLDEPVFTAWLEEKGMQRAKHSFQKGLSLKWFDEPRSGAKNHFEEFGYFLNVLIFDVVSPYKMYQLLSSFVEKFSLLRMNMNPVKCYRRSKENMPLFRGR